jgi:hypothetical protein
MCKKVRRAKCLLADGLSSDHVAAVNAYNGWKLAAQAATAVATGAGRAKAAATARAAAGAAAAGAAAAGAAASGAAAAGGGGGEGSEGSAGGSSRAAESPWQAQRSFCRLHWLSESTLEAVDQLRDQYRRLLCSAGFVPPPPGRRGHGGDEDDDDSDDGGGSSGPYDTTPASPYVSRMRPATATLVTAVLAAALCPAGVARVLWPSKNLGSGKQRSGSGGACYTRTERCLLHPGFARVYFESYNSLPASIALCLLPPKQLPLLSASHPAFAALFVPLLVQVCERAVALRRPRWQPRQWWQ